MTEYHILWEIEVSANSPREAAEIARDIQRDPSSDVGTFDVFPPDSDECFRIDLGDQA